MEETQLVIMQKDSKTGFLEKELGSYKISEHENYIVNIFAEEINEKLVANLKVTTGKDLEDWEFDAVYDYYDTEIFKALNVSVKENEDVFNPTWTLIFPYNEDFIEMEELITKLLNLHVKELESVFIAIKELESEYK